MSAPSQVADVFDRVADTYDAVGVPWFGPIARALVDELAPVAGERVAELGPGRGAATLLLAEAVGPSGRVDALDLAPRMVALLAADAAHLPQVQVRVGDAAAPALPAGAYDVVAASLVLFFLPDPAAAAQAWARLLVPGGRLGVTTFGPLDPLWERVDALFTPYLPPRLLDARTSGRRGPFADDAGVAGLLTGAGLVDVRTVHLGVDALLDDVPHWVRWSQSHGQRAMWDAVPEAEHPALQRAAAALFADARDDDGRVRLHQDVRVTVGARPAD